MSAHNTMLQAYVEAIYFTETGDSDQPPTDAKLSPADKAKAWVDCRNFLESIGAVPGGEPLPGVQYLNPSQLGHDLWLTRNGHGAGFWDRPEIYTSIYANLFTRLAKAMGGHDVTFEE